MKIGEILSGNKSMDANASPAKMTTIGNNSPHLLETLLLQGPENIRHRERQHRI